MRNVLERAALLAPQPDRCFETGHLVAPAPPEVLGFGMRGRQWCMFSSAPDLFVSRMYYSDGTAATVENVCGDWDVSHGAASAVNTLRPWGLSMTAVWAKTKLPPIDEPLIASPKTTVSGEAATETSAKLTSSIQDSG